MLTGGVLPSSEDITQWIDAGAACLGMGDSLISRGEIKAGDFDQIKHSLEAALAHIRKARQRSAASP